MINELKLFEYLQSAGMAALEGRKIDPVEYKKSRIALQAFLNLPKTMYKKKIQAVGVSTDFALLDGSPWNLTIETDNFDMGWEQAYKTVTLATGRFDWTIYNVANSLTFVKVEEGQRIEVAGLSGSRAKLEAEYYGGAIGWTDKMIRAREIPAMVDLAGVFRNKFFANKANNHYALLAAAAALTNVPLQGVAADGITRRVVLTINRAAFLLGDTNKDKGYGDAANAPFVIYANPDDEHELEAAFRVTSGQLVAARENGTAIGNRRIRRIYTYDSNIIAGNPIMIWPGQKIQKAEKMPPTSFKQQVDVLTLNQVEAVWSIYGAGVGDTEQTINFNIS